MSLVHQSVSYAHANPFPSLKRSPITNDWERAEKATPNVETTMVFRGKPGAQYAHHPQITTFQGRLIATWSSGLIHEDAEGQSMQMATSEDGGKTWSAPTVVAPHSIGGFADGIVTNGGIYVYEDSLIAYYGHYRHEGESKRLAEEYVGGNSPLPTDSDVFTGILVSHDAGKTWQDTGERIERLIPNLGPQRLKSGRLLLPGHTTFYYTDDPAGLSGWKRAGLPVENQDYADSPSGFYAAAQQLGLEGLAFCEASCYEMPDGTIQMLMRTIVNADIIKENPFVLAVTQSRDQGVTWSEPMLTDFVDCGSKFQFGTLPDGRYYCVSCPQPHAGRTPLVLSVSSDGIAFSKHYIIGSRKDYPPRYPGRYKGGVYGYATSCLDENTDTLFIIYSLGKEDIEISRIQLSRIH